jgi:hypothetical protein
MRRATLVLVILGLSAFAFPLVYDLAPDVDTAKAEQCYDVPDVGYVCIPDPSSAGPTPTPPGGANTYAPPAAPTGITVVALSQYQVQVSWNPSAGATSYTATGGGASATTASTSATLSSPQGFYFVTFYVTAYNQWGGSGQNGFVCGNCQAGAPPPPSGGGGGGGGGTQVALSAPTNLAARSTGTNSLRLQWSEHAAVEEYVAIYMGSDAAQFAVLGANSTSFDATGLGNGQHCFWVRVQQGANQSSASNSVCPFIGPSTDQSVSAASVPAPLGNPEPVPGHWGRPNIPGVLANGAEDANSISLAWNDLGGPARTSYEVFMCTGPWTNCSGAYGPANWTWMQSRWPYENNYTSSSTLTSSTNYCFKIYGFSSLAQNGYNYSDPRTGESPGATESNIQYWWDNLAGILEYAEVSPSVGAQGIPPAYLRGAWLSRADAVVLEVISGGYRRSQDLAADTCPSCGAGLWRVFFEDREDNIPFSQSAGSWSVAEQKGVNEGRDYADAEPGRPGGREGKIIYWFMIFGNKYRSLVGQQANVQTARSEVAIFIKNEFCPTLNVPGPICRAVAEAANILVGKAVSSALDPQNKNFVKYLALALDWAITGVNAAYAPQWVQSLPWNSVPEFVKDVQDFAVLTAALTSLDSGLAFLNQFVPNLSVGPTLSQVVSSVQQSISNWYIAICNYVPGCPW